MSETYISIIKENVPVGETTTSLIVSQLLKDSKRTVYLSNPQIGRLLGGSSDFEKVGKSRSIQGRISNVYKRVK